MKPRLIIGNKNYSSWSLRPWLLMKEAGIEFDEHRIVLDTPTTKQEIAAVTNAGRVPVLQLGDLTVWDSLAICETVAERWPDKQLWPGDPDERAHARAISAEMHSGFHFLRDCMPMNCRAMGRKVPIPDELGEDIDRIIAIWAECHHHYGDRGGWLFGDFSVADAVFAPVVLRLRTYGINLPESAGYYPHRLLESEAMQDWLAAAECETEVIEADEKGQ
ncbi:MAG: glutathione S-transferase family protein [Gammaproteobacteria bacterium]|nr:glutathione S-transferase family protein [Gammaproteobacteria bacterium]NNF50446.1 glutathione S-transferase family protein [Woeseiaceae bacterium]MBT8094985.1 glutathione S-transferase family protein [Gammaproteobacteria bacterium]MBT8104655.1 glutathione S-transferase family protein [Gammaproteobacteria bacterium]NNK24669.1 glutathione S-transferase family protein [Woeseiaceae bacterium]